MSAEEYKGELADIKQNVQNLSECLQSVLNRINQLEHCAPAAQEMSTVDPSDPNTTKQVHVEESEETEDDGTRIKRIHVTERVVTTKTFNTIQSPDCEYKPFTDSMLRGSSSAMENGFGGARETAIGYRRKKTDEHLALTAKPQDGHLIITEAPKDSPLVKQGLLHVGDTILEVNGKEVTTPDELNKAWASAGEQVNLKVIPNKQTPISPDAKFVRAQFDWDPQQEKDLSCKDIGLKFKTGDVLHIVNYDDKDWWQARKINDLTKVGLIPSKKLHDAKDSKRSSDCYLEVSKLSPYGRRVLVLLGAPGVGRRTIKSMLLQHDHHNFATVTPYTSRAKRDKEQEGREYHFTKRDAMQKEIDKGGYVEWGEYNSNLYGTSVNSVRDVIRTGRVCVLDCSPQAAKYLYNKEFMPFVLFVAPPSFDELKQLYQVHPNRTKNKSDDELKKTCEESAKLEQQYKNLIDLTLVNRNVDVTFRRLIDALESLKSDTQWIPSSWAQ